VALTWAEVVDTDRWVPAADGAPASEYVVLRDGAEIATVPEPVFRDEVRTEAAATGPTTVEYAVLAVDASGNRSEAASVVVELPAAGEGAFDRAWLAPMAAIVLLAAGGVVYLLIRRRRLALAE
jgi:hypothetical protein